MAGGGSGHVRSTGSFAAKTATVAVISIVGAGVATRVGLGTEVGRGVRVGRFVAIGVGKTVFVGVADLVAGSNVAGASVGQTGLVATVAIGLPIVVASGRLSDTDWQAASASILIANKSNTR